MLGRDIGVKVKKRIGGKMRGIERRPFRSGQFG
jgi:hypothetical protein